MKNMLKIIVIIIFIIVVALGIFFWYNSKPMTYEEADRSIKSLLEKQVNKKDTVSSGLIYVDAPKYGLSETYSVGTENGQDVKSDQPFHVASVGKAFTATLIGVLMEKYDLSLDNHIIDYIDESLLEGLFIVNEKDYSHQVTVRHLLSHTSGAADYFEDKTIESPLLTDLMLSDPNKIYTAYDLLDFTRDFQSPVGKPGEVFHYSDTGYILLGLIIEAISGESFDQMLHNEIFIPLDMNDSYLLFYSEPRNDQREIADVWLNGKEISGYNSLSIDWSGGGIVSTLDDLSTFTRALNQGGIIKEETLSSLYQFNNKYMRGIHYGSGFMEYHFEEYFPTLKSLPKMRGHMGVLGTQMFYDKETDTTYICSFGSTDFAAGSVQTMISILGIARRIK